jgi:AraC family transcriptional regulator
VVKSETRSFYHQAVQRAVEHVAANLDEALELAELAGTAALSPFHFHRVFRGITGETPLELHRRLRMERAAWRLCHGEDSVTRIAFDAGYETHEAFTRAFKSSYSASPSGFRRRQYPRWELSAASGVHFSPTGEIPHCIPRDWGGRDMNVEIKTLPRQRLATVRHVGPYNQIPVAFERLGQLAGPLGVLGQPDSAMLALYHDDPESTPQHLLRSDAALVIGDDVVLPKELTEQQLPPGQYAMTTHIGPYEQLGDTWARLMGEWLPQSGHRLGAGVSFELYRNTPENAPKHQLRTELYVPIE